MPVRYLQAGDYELYQYMMPGGPSAYYPDVNGIPIAGSDQEFWAPRNFSLRFRVEPGKVTYIGSFSYQPPDDTQAFLAILDRHERDLPIARKADPKLPQDVILAVPEVAKGAISRLQETRH